MSEENSLAARGIAAYEAGDKREAAQLLSEAVKDEKTNETAWYYLAQLLANPEKKRHCLEMVLRINPDHAEARAELAALEHTTSQSDGGVDQPGNVQQMPRPGAEGSGAEASVSASWASAIPGAPASITASQIMSDAQHILQGAVEVFTGQRDPLDDRVTWWNFVMIGLVIGFVNGLLFITRGLIFNIRVGSTPAIPGLFTRPFLAMFIIAAALGIACFVSYWYLKHGAGGQGDLLKHNFLVARIWALPAVLMGVLYAAENLFSGTTLVLTFNRLMSTGFTAFSGVGIILTAIALVIALYTLQRLARGLEKLHGVESRPAYIAAALTLILIALLV